MDHLESMGVDALWLSPIFHMRHEDFHGHGAYHGYWLHDMEAIEPYFGGEEDLKILSSEMESRQWNLILDMVYNHVSFDSEWVTQNQLGFMKPKALKIGTIHMKERTIKFMDCPIWHRKNLKYMSISIQSPYIGKIMQMSKVFAWMHFVIWKMIFYVV